MCEGLAQAANALANARSEPLRSPQGNTFEDDVLGKEVVEANEREDA